MRNLLASGAAADWFLVATKPRKETVAALNLENQGFSVFLPQMRRTVRHARKTSVRAVPLFPGYLFLKASATTRWRSINGTLGAIQVIMSGEGPALVERGFVEALRARTGPSDIVDFRSDLRTGGRVELIGGPFARQIGNLAELDERGRVTVLLEFLAARVPVRTTVENLLPV
jgi:transcriptional antiterminator RfaH